MLCNSETKISSEEVDSHSTSLRRLPVTGRSLLGRRALTLFTALQVARLVVDGKHSLLQAGQPALERVQDAGHAVRQLVRGGQHLTHLGHPRQLLGQGASRGRGMSTAGHQGTDRVWSGAYSTLAK